MRKKALIRFIILLFLASSLSLVALAKEKEVKSSWAVTPIKIDGFNNDWAGAVLNTEKKVSTDYGFQNDKENFYVVFIFKDKKYLSSIGATGMTMWFSSEKKKKKNYGIKFIQRKISADDLIARLEKESEPLPEERKQEIRANRSYVVYDAEEINKEKKASLTAKKGAKTASFRFLKQQNNFVFEFVVPLEMIVTNIPDLKEEPAQKIKVGFEWGGLTKEMKAALMRRRAALGETRGMEFEPDSNLAGAGAGSSVPIGALAGPKKYEFWLNVQLAQLQ